MNVEKPNIYFLPGLGVDERVFYMLDIKGANRFFCNVFKPEKNETLRAYAQRMIEEFNIKPNSILVGLSFGGILAAEINDILPMKKIILLSSIKEKSERPFWITLQDALPIHTILPAKIFKWGAIAASPFVGKMSYDEFDVYLSMVDGTDDDFYKWAVNQVIKWDRTEYADNILHIHGRNDLIFPINFIKGDFIRIEGGAHTLVLRYAEQVSALINVEIEAAKKEIDTKLIA